ncbi:hypothetical protein [Siccirubricoccus sp. G192]|uniref:hypothetical protein n=1 Tax=Siccirubricoccus sp. G192 TaxID=2849651 RepID=UPI001C2C19E6|nr:hypothetical protein [Siccirubricoccus sp. G192]MBV1800473.1 hypothetical protein [Siccirubricoccus sp. G192]
MATTGKAHTTRVRIFGSDKGGVGKSLAAQAAVSRVVMETGALPLIIEVEAEPRLALIYGDAVTLFRLSANSLEEIERNPRLLYAMWEAIGELILAHAGEEIVVDLGANLTRALTAWLHEYGEDGPLGSGERTDFYALTTGEANALASANNALAYVAQALPASRRLLLVNQRDEHLFPLDPASTAVRATSKPHGAEIAVLPRCMSPALAAIVDERMRLDVAMGHPIEWWASRGMPRLEAVRAVRRLTAWAEEAMAVFAPPGAPA